MDLRRTSALHTGQPHRRELAVLKGCDRDSPTDHAVRLRDLSENRDHDRLRALEAGTTPLSRRRRRAHRSERSRGPVTILAAGVGAVASVPGAGLEPACLSAAAF